MSFALHTSQLIATAQQALDAARSVPELKWARDLAVAARSYARGTESRSESHLSAACLAIRAEHALGVALSQTEFARGGPGNQYKRKKRLDRSHDATGSPRLRDFHLTKSASQRAQQLAALTRDELQCWLEAQCAAGIEPTLKAARRFARETAQPKQNGAAGRMRGE